MSHDENQPLPQQDHEEEKPEIFAVSRDENEMTFDRRDFLRASMFVAGAAATVAAGAAMLDGSEVSAGTDLQAATRTPRPTRTPQVTATPGEPCTVWTDQPEVNIHVGPGRHRGIVDYMPTRQEIPVIGKAKDKNGLYWWQVEIEGIAQAWVHPDDVRVSGDCSGIIDVDAPPFVPAATATPASTSTPIPQGTLGTVPPGQTGINYTSGGRTYTLPCGSPLPPGAVCICNCVTVPRGCACDGYCSCAGRSHYWYPN